MLKIDRILISMEMWSLSTKTSIPVLLSDWAELIYNMFNIRFSLLTSILNQTGCNYFMTSSLHLVPKCYCGLVFSVAIVS